VYNRTSRETQELQFDFDPDRSFEGGALTMGTTLEEILENFPDFELYKHEAFFGGNPSAEREAFRGHVTKVREVQQQLANRSGGTSRRVFHAKSHGVLLGELRLRAQRPSVVRKGIFDENAPASYPVLARFSNGKGIIEADSIPDVRGVALKIFDVVPSEAERTMDLLMTNSPVAFGKDHAEFVEFMVESQNTLSLGEFLLTHPRVGLALARASAVPPIGGMTTVTFGSGHAYLLGPENAMKFKLTPPMDVEQIHRRAAELLHLLGDPNYLGTDLKTRAAREEIHFVLSIQLETNDQQETPIEDTLVEWREEVSKAIPVADLVFPIQNVTDARRDFADRLAFTPWNYISDHRPLGNLARGRLFSYLASAGGRKARPNLSFQSLKVEWDAL
jgi:hypothetical protein